MFRFFTFFIVLTVFRIPKVNSGIKIGLISDHDYRQNRIVFQKAIEVANRQLEIPLTGIILEVQFGNVYASSKKLCNILQSGVSIVLGPSSRSTAQHLMNICDDKEMPYVDPYINFNEKKSAITFYPHSKQLTQAICDIIKAYKWKRFIFLYESGEYLQILYDLTSCFACDGPEITIRRYNIGEDKNCYSILQGIRKSKTKCVLVAGSLKSLPDLLNQAQQVGLITYEYQFIIANLDFHTVDIRPYQHSDANITSVRIINPDDERVKYLIKALGYHEDSAMRNISCPVTSYMAFIYDAVQHYAEITKRIRFHPISINCSEGVDWKNGFTINNYFSFDSTNGITGELNFEFEQRTKFSLDVISLDSSGFTKLGIWGTDEGLNIKHVIPPVVVENDDSSLINKTLVVLTAISPPYGMLKHSAEKLKGNDQYEGFGIDLIHMLSVNLGFNYTFRLQEDNNYGSFNATTNQSTGMMKQLLDGNADLAITDLTITSERELAVDFTIPFMNLGISILYRKPQKEPPKLFSFMDPFSKEVWLYLGAAYIGVSLSFFILGRISPAEWINPYPCTELSNELENQFRFGNSLWFTIGALLQQGSEIAPKAPSTRTVASIWWFFTIIMVASYTANLAAFLTVESLSSPIDDVDDLAANKGGVKYGAKRGGATVKFFESSKKYEKMRDYMNSHPELLTATNDEGVQKVLEDNYAFLMESTSIEYHVERKCNLTQIGSLLDEKGYGIAMKKGWPYRNKLSYALLELQEAGELSKLKAKWWKEVGTDGCSKKKETEKAKGLGMPNLGGVFFVLLVGSTLATIFGIFKWIFVICHKAYVRKVSVKEKLINEIKFVLDCSQNTKSLKAMDFSFSQNSSITMEFVNGSSSNKEDKNSAYSCP